MLKKFVFAGIGFAFCVSPLVASADQISDLQSQIKALLTQIEQLKAQITTPAVHSTGNSIACLVLTNSLSVDDTDTDNSGEVSKLQQFLAQDSSIYPDGRITGYFGPATLRAVQRWQKVNGVVSSGDPDSTGYGFVGAKTRAALAKGCLNPSPEPTICRQIALTGCPEGMHVGGTCNLSCVPDSTAGAPTISGLDAPTSLSAGQAGTWSVHASVSNQSKQQLHYSVTWGDEGAQSLFTTSAAVSAALNVSGTFTHTYQSAGTYTPVFTVSNDGGSAQTSATVVVSGSGVNPPTTGTQVQAQDISIGSGAQATPGTQVSVTYVGKLSDGTVFDSIDMHGGVPLTFTLGSPGLIAGFQIGVNGMRVGGERQIAIPPALGYGSQAVTDATGKVLIPANSLILFDIKLVNIGPGVNTIPSPSAPQQSSVYIDKASLSSSGVNPFITGTANGISSLAVQLTNASGVTSKTVLPVRVSGGRWSVSVNSVNFSSDIFSNDSSLASGTYAIAVYDPLSLVSGTALATSTLTFASTLTPAQSWSGPQTFNGISQYASLGALQDSPAFTISAWVRYTGSICGIILSDSTPDGGNDLFFGVDGTHVFIRADKSGATLRGSDSCLSTYALPLSSTITGSWHKVAWVNYGSRSDVYLDGTLAGSANLTASNIGYHSAAPSIAADTGAFGIAGNYFSGSLANVVYFNGALTQNQLASLYAGQSTPQ